MNTDSASSSSAPGTLWLARMFGVVSIALGVCCAFVGVVLCTGEKPEASLVAFWPALVLGLAGAVPFVPVLSERPWRARAWCGLAYLLVVNFLAAGAIASWLASDRDSRSALLHVAGFAAAQLPGVWLVRKGLGPRSFTTTPALVEADPLLGELHYAHRPTRPVLVAAGLLGWSAALAGFSGLQLLGVKFLVSWLNAVPYAMLAFAAALGWCALGVYKLRFVEAVAALALAGLGAALGGTWLVFSIRAGLMSLFAMLWPFVSAVAAVCVARHLGYVRKATAARERLEDAGLSLGL